MLISKDNELQILFVMFTVFGSVIVMNLIMALMVNQMNMGQAEAMLQTNRVEEISDKIEVATTWKILRRTFCCEESNTEASTFFATDSIALNRASVSTKADLAPVIVRLNF